MRIKIVPLLFLFVVVSICAYGGERAECIGPVAVHSAKFPCVAKPAFPLVSEQFQSQQEHFQSHLGEVSSPKSPGKAFFLSLLVPGLGEYYAGSPSKARFFLAAEATVWSGVAVFEHYSAWKKRDYKLYAVTHAGVNLEGKDDDYFKNVDAYSDIRSYNEDQLLARDMDNVYWDEALYFWEWDSEESRTTFSQLRKSSRKAHRRAVNFMGLAVLNRLVSAIDALRTARAFNRSIDEGGFGLNLDFKIRGSFRNPQALLVLEKTF